MKYYSEITRKAYDTEKDCIEAETQVKNEQEEKARIEAEKKQQHAQDAQAVEEMRKVAVATQKHYEEALRAFIKKYGSYYYSTSNVNEMPWRFPFFF